MSAPSLSSLNKSLAVEPRRDRLPIDAGHCGLIEDEQRRHSRSDRDGKIGCCDLLDVELKHHVLGDLPALAGTILQTRKPVLHFGNPAFEPRCQGFIGQSRAHDGCDNLMHVGQSLDRIGEGLFIDVGIFRPDPVADGAVANGGKFQGHGFGSTN